MYTDTLGHDNVFMRKNLDDIRSLISLYKDSIRLKDMQHQNENDNLCHKLSQQNDTILMMRDTLILVFKYLHNTKKLESFMRSKHDNDFLVMMKYFTKGNSSLPYIHESPELIKLAINSKLVDLIQKELVEELK